jgi:hypothetical protein
MSDFIASKGSSMEMPKSQQELEEAIASRALKDADFRREFISDPKGVLSREFGLSVPDEITIKVVEDQPGTAHIVLPAVEAGAGDQASGQIENFAASPAYHTGQTAIQFTACCGT